jgi:hypothetical protein
MNPYIYYNGLNYLYTFFFQKGLEQIPLIYDIMDLSFVTTLTSLRLALSNRYND